MWIFWISQVDFYISQSEADNHAVREAACACIAELGTKINKDCVRPYVTRLLDSLKICFEDDSWPVRDGRFNKSKLVNLSFRAVKNCSNVSEKINRVRLLSKQKFYKI